MNLIVDIGNTAAKIAVIDENEIVARRISERLTDADFDELFERYKLIDKAIVSSSGSCGDEVAAMLERRADYVLKLDAETPIPLRNGYATPETLGPDRIAAAVGAQKIYGRRNMMIVDFGTAITVDLVIDGEFKGGNISPGLSIRFRALHEYTAKLPLCAPTSERLDFGTTTRTAIEQGVMTGVEHEIGGYIAEFEKKYENLCIIFTGGDAIFFDKRIKNTIFASRELNFFGLNEILEYNVDATKRSKI